MSEMPIKDARQGLKALLARVEAGEEVVLTRRGRPVARVTPIGGQVHKRLPLQSDFRTALSVSGRHLSGDILAARTEERF